MGSSFRNFKCLCQCAGVKVCDGGSKLAFLKDLRQYCKIEKEAGKQHYRVEEIYKKPIPKVDKRADGNNGKFKCCGIDQVLLDYFKHTIKYSAFYTPRLLMRRIGIVNDNYFEFLDKEKNLLSNWGFPSIERELGNCNIRYRQAIESSIERLAKQKYICAERVWVLVDLKEGPRIASTEQSATIAQFELQYMSDNGFDGIQSVYASGRKNEFYRVTGESACQEFDCKFIYKATNITLLDKIHEVRENSDIISQNRKNLNQRFFQETLDHLLQINSMREWMLFSDPKKRLMCEKFVKNLILRDTAELSCDKLCALLRELIGKGKDTSKKAIS